MRTRAGGSGSRVNRALLLRTQEDIYQSRQPSDLAGDNVASALLAIYVRATCPESPYWIRTQDRKRRIAATLAAGGILSAEDRSWYTKADKVGIRQVFMPDVLPATLVAV